MSVKNASSGREKTKRGGAAAVAVVLTDDEMREKEPSGSFAWKVLPPTVVRALMQCKNPDELEIKMADVLKLSDYETELKDACQLDCYVTAFHWGKEQHFDERQMSGFITLVHNTLDNIKSGMSKLDNLSYMKDCFAGVGLDCSEVVPISLYFFNLHNSKLIVDYLISTTLKHYSLYQYLFSSSQDELIIGKDVLIETSPANNGPFPPPLAEAMSYEVYQEFVLKSEEAARERERASKEADFEGEQFTEAVIDKVMCESAAASAIPTHELRRIVEKLTRGTILPAKHRLQDKIREKETTLLSRIDMHVPV